MLLAPVCFYQDIVIEAWYVVNGNRVKEGDEASNKAAQVENDESFIIVSFSFFFQLTF
jgi:hypothetical protein